MRGAIGVRWSDFVRGLLALTVVIAASLPSVSAARTEAYIVIDAQTGEVLQSYRSERRVHPASLTKMMTLYLAFSALEQGKFSFDTVLRTSRHAAKQPASKLGLRNGERIRAVDAIRATAVSSSNDASVVLAEAISGTEAAFARRMTRTARALGMRRTTFRNASGLTAKGHLSSAYDMAVLSRALWRDFPRHYALFSRKRVKIGKRKRRATNTLLGVSPGVDGIKTGYTRAAGHSLSASASRKGRRVIVVYLGGPTRPKRDRTVQALLNHGFAKLAENIAPSTAPTPRLRPEPHREELIAVGSTKAPASRPVRVAAKVAPPRAPAPSRRPAPAAREKTVEAVSIASAWSVQVGAFRAERRADAHLRRLLDLETPGIGDGSGMVVSKRMSGSLSDQAAKTVYRARFTGLDEKGARSACAFLRKRSYPCALVPPGGWALARAWRDG